MNPILKVAQILNSLKDSGLFQIERRIKKAEAQESEVEVVGGIIWMKRMRGFVYPVLIAVSPIDATSVWSVSVVCACPIFSRDEFFMKSPWLNSGHAMHLKDE